MDNRTIYYTEEFNFFYNQSSLRIQKKINFLSEIIINHTIIHSKLVKKSSNSPFYELRFRINNEYRVILITIDHQDINQCSKLLFLNGFIKKSTKSYKQELIRAHKIKDQWIN